MMFDDLPDEWKEWIALSPIERFRESEKMFAEYLDIGNLDSLRAELDREVRAEQAKDRAYWAPLKQELEAMRHAQGQGSQ